MSNVAVLLGLVNAKNSTAFTEAQLTFGAPVAIEGALEGARNTNVTVTGVTAAGYTSDKQLAYTRLDLTKAFEGVVGGLKAFGPRESGTTLDLLDDIKAQTGVEILPTDIVEEAVDFSVAGTHVLKAAAGNLKWIGGVYVAISLDLEDINATLTQGDLDGFTYPVIA